jgi:hypothetical protein
MNNAKRKITIFGLAALAGVCLATSVSMVAITGIADEEATPATWTTTETFRLKGASVRLIDDEYGAGIKFHVVMEKATYEALPDGVTTGMKLLPVYLLSAGETIETTTSEKVVKQETTDVWFENADGAMESIVYVYNIPASQYGTDIAVVGYVTDGTTTEYSTSSAISMAWVANKEYTESTATFYQSEKLESYITYSLTLDGVEQTEKIHYGETLTLPESDEWNKEIGWYNESGTAEWSAETTVTGNVKLYAHYSSILAGKGTEDSPYEIGTKAQWDYLTQQVNEGKHDCSGEYFKLTADIDGVDTMIGVDKTNYFKGNFDGNGKTITINLEQKTGDYAGVFLYNYGTIKNLTVDGNIRATGNYVGGIVASNFGTVENCVNNAKVTSTADYVGGIVGYNRSQVIDCTNNGSVQGANRVGGIAARMESNTESNTLSLTQKVEHCVNNGSVSATTNYVGGIVGAMVTGTVKNCANNGMVTLNGAEATAIHSGTATTNSKGYFVGYIKDGTIDTIGINALAGYEMFANVVSSTTGASFAGQTVQLWDNIGDETAPVTTVIGNGNSNYFDGVFDGNGKTVYLKLEGTTDRFGMFSYAGAGGDSSSCVIKNLTVDGSVSTTGLYVGGVVGAGYVDIENCVNRASVCGGRSVGGIIGYCRGTLFNCSNSGTIVATTPDENGSFFLGGIVGNVESEKTITKTTSVRRYTAIETYTEIEGEYTAMILNCSNSGTLKVDNDSAETIWKIGGIVGQIKAGTSIIGCYNSGAIESGTAQVGGIAGYAYSAVSDKCFSYCYQLGATIQSVGTKRYSSTGEICTIVGKCTAAQFVSSGDGLCQYYN